VVPLTPSGCPEAGLDVAVPISRRAAELIAFDYIETFYNLTRRHSSLGYLSPVASKSNQRKTTSNRPESAGHFFEASPHP
jgi:hypothetical protein